MRFRRRQRILPGVYINFSSSGISTTLGGRGASINIGRNGTYLNTSIPGTGLYNRQRLDFNNNSYNQGSSQSQQINNSTINSINTNTTHHLTSPSLLDLKDTFHECYSERAELATEIKKVKLRLFFFELLNTVSILIIIGIFIKWFKKNVLETKNYINDLKYQYENCVIAIDINISQNIESHFTILSNRYRELCTCAKIWDLISYTSQSQKVTRSSAEAAVERRVIAFSPYNINIIKSKFQPLHFTNANGGDIFIYPGFVYYYENEKTFALIDFKDINFTIINQQFIEEEGVPADAMIVKQVWAKSNADGSPDRRFKNNYQIPVCQYGRIDFMTSSGLNESYMFSDYNKARDFAQAFYSLLQITKS